MATLERDILDKVGKYNLSELTIISYRQDKEESKPKTIDIRGITLTLSITEDIFSNNLVGSLVVYDTQDIRSIFPITGLERLSLKLNTPGLPGFNYTEDNGVPFQIYKVDNVKKEDTTGAGQFYKIFFCSPEMYNNNIALVSKAYAGPVENGVLDIVRQSKYLNSKKPIYVEPTKTNAKYVIPSLKPYNAIRFLNNNAISAEYQNAGYLFYETNRGFHLRSIESMLAMGGAVVRPARWNFNTQIVSVKDSKKEEVKDIQRRMQTVIRYEFDKPVDTLANIQGGLYANQLIVHDAFNKTITKTDYNYKNDFKNHFHLEHDKGQKSTNKYILPDSQYADTNKTLFDFPDAKVMVKSQTTKVHNDYEFVPYKNTLQQLISQRVGFNNMNLTMLVYGNTNLNAGDVINFTCPILQPEANQPQPYTSGRYLIMAIKHTISVETKTHEMVIKCYKDSVRNAYPSESDPLITGKSDTSSINIYQEDLVTLDGLAEL
jgi:hypothetical protein